MNYLLLGLGFVGQEVARLLQANGHAVIGTTTTPAKVEQLRRLCQRIEVLTGDEAARMAELARGCDGLIVTVGPNVRRARTPEEREQEYRRALAVTCQNAAAAAATSGAHCVFVSSLSVYGDGGGAADGGVVIGVAGDSAITEETPLSQAREPSAVYYQMAERNVLDSGGAVLRVPDVYGGANDMSYAQRVELAHSLMGGKVPFGPDALLYRIHCKDVARAVLHALDRGLSGAFNVCDNTSVPPTNREVFDRLTDAAGLPRLVFLGQIKLPTRVISGEKFARTGFECLFTDYSFE